MFVQGLLIGHLEVPLDASYKEKIVQITCGNKNIYKTKNTRCKSSWYCDLLLSWSKILSEEALHLCVSCIFRLLINFPQVEHSPASLGSLSSPLSGHEGL